MEARRGKEQASQGQAPVGHIAGVDRVFRQARVRVDKSKDLVVWHDAIQWRWCMNRFVKRSIDPILA